MADIPKIRFKGFADAWEQRKLGEVVTEVKRTDENSDAPVMMITANEGFINQSERYSNNNAGQSLKKYIVLEKGELAYNHGASKVRPYGSCFALTTEEKARIPFVYHCFATNTENAEFLSITLNGKSVEWQLRRIVSSGARMDGLLNISFEEYTSIPVVLPSVAEQNQIATYFRHLDRLITLHQHKCDETKELKRYMLQKMFPQSGKKNPEIRFAGFTDDWEQRKLGDVFDFQYGEFNNNPNNGGEYPIYGANGVIGGYTKYNAESSSVIGHMGAYAGYVVWAEGKHFVTYNGTIAKPSDDSLDNKFGYYLLSNKQIYKICAGSGQPFVSYADLNGIDVVVPKDISEQITIGKYFSHLDHLITLHQRKCGALKEVKKFMLQNMFPQKG